MNMRTRKKHAMLALLLLTASGPAFAVNVRGRIDFGGPSGAFPMANATVVVCWGPNACITYVTGNDGMFYMQLNPGQYSVGVNGVYKISVAIPDQPNYDIPPILGN